MSGASSSRLLAAQQPLGPQPARAQQPATLVVVVMSGRVPEESKHLISAFHHGGVRCALTHPSPNSRGSIL
jgi:hypothetical protein